MQNRSNLVTEYRMSFKVIDSLYLYYPRSNLVISNYGYFDKNAFYDKDIIEQLEDKEIPNFDCLFIKRKINYPDNYNQSVNKYVVDVLTIVRLVPFNNNGTLLILNVKDEIFSDFNDSNKTFANMVSIIDKSGNEMFSSQFLKSKLDEEFYVNALKSIPQTSESGFFTVDDHLNMTVFYSELNKYGLRTVMFMPNNFIYANFDVMRDIVIGIFLLVISISLSVSYFITQKLYNPIRSLLLKFLGKDSNTTNVKSKDEFGVIEKSYNYVMNQNLEIKKKLLENLPLFKELFLRNILDGKISDVKVVHSKAEFLGIDIKNAVSFAVYVILIGDPEIKTEDAFQLQYLKEVVSRIIRNEINSKNVEILHNFTEDDMIILISWSNHSDEEVLFIPDRINAAIKNQLVGGNLNVFISVGLPVNNIMDLSYSYTTAIDAINYMGKKSNVIYANDIVHLPRTPSHLLANDEKQLLLSILNCDRKKAIDIFDKIINDVVEENVSYEYFQQIIIQILNDILKFIEINNTSTAFMRNNLYKEVLNLKTIRKTRNWFVNQLNDMINYLEANKSDPYSKLIADIISYIHKNYNKDINLEITAQHFSLSRQYFSKIFYEKVGQSFNDYLNSVRLDMSLVYLKETNESVKSIAEKVGFSSSQYYIKLFKDKYGLTPGQYREIINSSREVDNQDIKFDHNNSVHTKLKMIDVR